MATTSPDGLISPNAGDPYNLVTDWAASMSSVQAALIGRANHVGTTSQRTAFAAKQGALWWDTSVSRLFIYNSGSWTAVSDESYDSYSYSGATSNLSSLTLVFRRQARVVEVSGSLSLDSGWAMGNSKPILASGSVPSEWRPPGTRVVGAMLGSSTIHRGGDLSFSASGGVIFGMSDTPPSSTSMSFSGTYFIN